VHEASTGVGHGLELLPPFTEVGAEPVELLDLHSVDLLLVLAVVLLYKLVLLLVLVLLLGESVVLELFLVDAVDDVQVVLDFLFLAQGDGLLLVGLEVAGGVDLVIFLLVLAEDLVALDEVGPNQLLDVLLAGYTLIEYVLQDVVVVRDLGFLLNRLGETLLVFFYLIYFS